MSDDFFVIDDAEYETHDLGMDTAVTHQDTTAEIATGTVKSENTVVNKKVVRVGMGVLIALFFLRIVIAK